MRTTTVPSCKSSGIHLSQATNVDYIEIFRVQGPRDMLILTQGSLEHLGYTDTNKRGKEQEI